MSTPDNKTPKTLSPAQQVANMATGYITKYPSLEFHARDQNAARAPKDKALLIAAGIDPEDSNAVLEKVREVAYERIPVVRQNVADITNTDAVDDEAEENDEEPIVLRHIETMLSQSPMRKLFRSLSMVGLLIQEHYENGNSSVLSKAKFDEENLRNLMAALISGFRREEISTDDVDEYLLESEEDISCFVIYDLLGLEEDSGLEEVKTRMNKMKMVADGFKELRRYGQAKLVNNVVKCFHPNYRYDEDGEGNQIPNNEHQPGKNEDGTFKTAKQMIKEAGIKGQIFDADTEVDGEKKEGAITRVLARVRQEVAGRQTDEARVADEAANAIDFTEFYKEILQDTDTQASYWPLYNLYSALQRPEDAEYDNKDRKLFGELSRKELLAELDENLGDNDEDGEKLKQALQKAARAEEGDTNDEYFNYALMQAVAKHYKLTSDREGLKERLMEVYEDLGRLYPETLHEADPYKAEVLARSDDE